MVGQGDREWQNKQEKMYSPLLFTMSLLTQSKCLIRVSYCIIFKIFQTFFICNLYDISFCLHVLKNSNNSWRVWKTLYPFSLSVHSYACFKGQSRNQMLQEVSPHCHTLIIQICQNVLQKTQSTLCISLLTHLPYYFEMTV